MPLANCPRCSRAFNRISGVTLCDACRERDDEEFDRCYRYLRDHPNTSIPDVAEATDVDADRILEFYRTGRLIAGEAGYPCKRCGGPTQRGAYCARCVDSFKTGLGSDPTKPEASEDRPSGHVPLPRDFSLRMRTDRT